ncbi:MAG: ATP synthase F1 subunit delta [Bacilli bacterium]
MIDSIAKSYANALIDLLNESKISINDSVSELQLIGRIVSDEEISKFLNHPNIPTNEKIKIIEDALTNKKDVFNKTIVSFTKVLVENNRIMNLSDIIAVMNEYLDNLNNVVRVEIITNKEIKEKTLNEIIAYLEKEFKREVITSVTLDERIVGGIIVKRNGYVLDASILNKLKAIKDTVIYGE